MPDFRTRFFNMLPYFAACPPLLGAMVWYQLAMVATPQIGAWRVLGVLGICWWLAAGATVPLALLAAWLHPKLPPLGRRLARTLVWGAFLASMALLGSAVFYWSPAIAPRAHLLGGAAAIAVLIGAYARYAEHEQRFLLRVMTRLGLVALFVPVAASPGLAWAWVHRDSAPAGLPKVPAAPRATAEPPRRIVLVTFDALRAWSTSVHNPALDTTPHLAALARHATTFAQTRTVSDSTIVSLPALLSGVSPERFVPSVHSDMNLVPRGLLTSVADHLKPAGYRSYYATMLMSPDALGMQGAFDGGGTFTTRKLIFSEFQSLDFLPMREVWAYLADKLQRANETPSTHKPGLRRPGQVRATFDEAFARLAHEPEPIFVWAHLGVPHMPYLQITDFDPRHYGPYSRDYVARERLDRIEQGADPEEALKARRVYESFVGFADQELGRFLARLKQAGLYDDAMVIVTADHGENLVPGYFGHGIGPLKGGETWVPLVIKLPGQQLPVRVEQPVSLLDVTPTILSRVYQALPEGLSGQPLLSGPTDSERVLFADGWFTRHTPSRAAVPLASALFAGRYLYRRNLVEQRDHLFDLTHDPYERHDLATQQPALVAKFRARLDAHRAAYGEPPTQTGQWTGRPQFQDW